ncbi:hypothetical protein D6T64_01125 [Cryobacterium melibiosiphilum]|uniref:Lactococcin 972 family bacteriocin n=2 Tax=Cryobacterium TaxID=69578 RepID=A0A4R8ZUZ9_9MICO|nr:MULTISPECIES: lactococcin 972 family bacteriocin [Cryobacterium]RJT91879.1 hypothetical protein D6T64_01125 [Cryobacterium melibiosiphilum]TFD46780.1 hypothetical protein E3T55_16725 [Cryobacterium frigoriphilum]
MKNRWKNTIAALAIAAPLALSAGPAYAATEYPTEGGTWNYGNTMGHNYSDYMLETRHASTVICGDRTNRVAADGYKWSNAALTAVSGCGFWYDPM